LEGNPKREFPTAIGASHKGSTGNRKSILVILAIGIGVARLHELAESQNGDREGILRTLSCSPTDEEMEEEAHPLYREGLPARVEAL